MKNNWNIMSFGGLLVVLWVTTTTCAAAGGTGPAGAGPPEVWGENTQVVRFGRFFIAGQPDQAALERARESGVETVISLREESKSDWDEAAAVQSLGLEFHRVPVNGAAPELSPEALERVSQIVQEYPGANILVHCSSGNRASAWFAVYLSEYAGMDAEKAVNVARQTGLKGAMEEKVNAYLGQRAATESTSQ